MSKAALEKETFDDQNEHNDDNNDEDQDEQANLANKSQLQYKKSPPNISAQENLLHVVQFCYLCLKGKISLVLYSLSSNKEIDNWHQALPLMSSHKQINHHPNYKTNESNSKACIQSPKKKISRKDNYLINTMIKLHDTIDKNSKNKEEKDPGFTRLELHRKKLILNGSAVPPFDTEAPTPTEFYQSFLLKKSQFKAKGMLLHRFQIDKIAFHPHTTFVTNLWNCEFFCLLPDPPSGISSIFYCQEMKPTNTYETEREQYLALADKVKATDIEKPSKQKMYLPTTIMDLVWMTQSFHAMISLCFGIESHSSIFLKDWTDLIYENRLIYSSIYASDPCFYAKILFTIDNALQIHWQSCSSSIDCLSVNDRIL
jgi:hypothetical protein